MPASGRFEKRIRLAVAIEIFSQREPIVSERTVTENVCSQGARILAKQAREPNEPLLLRTLGEDLRIVARVVYCQRLPDGRFGVGVHLLGGDVHWPAALLARSED